MCSTKGIQVLLFIQNFIFWLVGTGLLGLGAYLLIGNKQPGILLVLSEAKTLCFIAIGVGAFLFLLGFIGCCGAANHNGCLLKTYVFILIVFVLAEIGIGVYIGLGFGVSQLEAIWKNLDDSSQGVIQDAFKCCGFYNRTDSSPSTSCSDTEIGCFTKIQTAINSLDVILLCVGAAIALLELLGILMSGYLACRGKEVEENQVMPMQPRGQYNGGYR
ncbi:leukocyte surface antigen CD53-like [Diadema antillarum]|uniref:leukocyte surface antigen CD53-like n=1 Tax=Diadema antillarum TaxID=105358 RepID=UPI003A839C8E